ncbi:MAG: hypothetical protein JWM70_992 [Microbacteriaceae bacterium]|nr:hypothetical protein [Microbacteriaceae bacterium]
MDTITDEQMRARMAATKQYTVLTLKAGPNRQMDGADQIIWEHGRRNFQLRADGLLAIVCPVRDGSDVSGFGIFTLGVDETIELMKDDPAVKAGIFVCEVHAARGFPGDALPS